MDTKVFREAREGNIDALREHKRDQLHVILTPTKNTVLHIYIACIGSATLTKSAELLKSTKVVEEMLKICPRLLLQPNESGDTALHLAARYGRADIVGVLIQAAKDCHGDLEVGISSKEVSCQNLIRTTNKEENTALHEAVRFNHLDVVKVLTKEDPEFLYCANDAGETPVYMAAERGYRDLVFEILGTCKNPSYQGPDGLTALHPAANYNDKQITRKLLETESALAMVGDNEGTSPLHLAAFRGHTSIVKQILECNNATGYVGDQHKRTALHHACRAGHVDVLKELIFYCPDSCELVDKQGRNALHYGIMHNHDQVEQFVREDPWLSSVLLNGKDADGNTPLHQIATSHHKYECMDFISDARVDKMAFNNTRRNALDIIQENTNAPLWQKNLRDDMRKAGARNGHRLYLRTKSDWRKAQKIKGDEDPKEKQIKESHLVVSALIATVSFAAAFTVPGGYYSEKGPDQGRAILSRNAAFKAFVMSNTLAMTMSSCAVMIRFFLLLKGQQHRSSSFYGAIGLTIYALVAMVVAFLTGTYAVLGGHSSLGLAITACVLGSFFFSVLGFVFISPVFHSSRKRAGALHRLLVSWLGLEYYCFI